MRALICCLLSMLVAAAAVPAWAGDDWPMFRHDPAHSGYSTSEAPDTNHVLWTLTTGAPVESSPAVADGNVYVGSGYEVYCLDAATGAEQWEFRTSGFVDPSPAVADGKVYVGSCDRKVYCLDAATGADLWEFTTGDSVWSSPAVADGKVYVGSLDNKVHCLDAATGGELWEFTTGSYVASSPAVVHGKVYVGSGYQVYCLDAATGAKQWQFYAFRLGGGYVESSPAVADGKVYVGCGDYKVYCLDAATGDKQWEFTTGYLVHSSPAVADGKVYVGSYDGNVYCLDAATGVWQWEFTTEDYVHSSPAVADGKVYVGSGYEVYCLDAATGAKQWEFTTGARVWSSPAVADGKVYVGSSDGNVYCFGGNNQPPVCSFTYSPPSPDDQTRVQFTDTSTDPDLYDQIVAWAWDFGDGGGSSEQNPLHTFPAGDDTVCLTVTDSSGADATCCQTIAVTHRLEPICSFTYSPLYPDCQTVVQFTDGSYDPDGQLIAWFWEFGDGSTSDQQNSTHQFAEGTYNVCLTVTNDRVPPLSSTCCQTIIVSDPAKWPMFHHDLAHSGYSTSDAPDTNHVLWTFATGFCVESSPAVADGKVYVGSDDYKVYCLDAATGAKQWEFTTGYRVHSSPAMAGGKVYVGSGDFKVYCLDAATGAEQWEFTTGWPVGSSPAVADGKVYVGSSDGKVYCLDAATGARQWQSTTGGYVHSSPAVAHGNVYVGSDDGNVYCLDAATGAKQWEFTTGSYVESSPAVADGKLYVGCGGKLYCLDAATGAKEWEFTTGWLVDSSPAVADGKVYVGSGDGNVYCLDAATGAWQWEFTTGNCVHSSPAVADGKVYVGSDDYNVYCLDAATGAKQWEFITGSCVPSSPAVADGKVYVGSGDYKVYCFADNMPPTCDIISGPPTPTVEDTITFYSGAADDDGSVISIDWTFGDDSGATGDSVAHQYTMPRTYTVTVTVCDDDGDCTECTLDITIGKGENIPPVCDVTYDPPAPETGQDITFNANAYDPNPWGEIMSCAWDFGDGHGATGDPATHTYSDVGHYTVCVTVTDDQGGQTTCCTQVTVTSPCDCDIAIDESHCIVPAAGHIGQCKMGQIGARNMSFTEPCDVVMRVTDNAGVVVFQSQRTTIGPGQRLRLRFEWCYTADEVGRNPWTWEVWPVECNELTPWDNVQYRRVNVQPGVRSSTNDWLLLGPRAPVWRR